MMRIGPYLPRAASSRAFSGSWLLAISCRHSPQPSSRAVSTCPRTPRKAIFASAAMPTVGFITLPSSEGVNVYVDELGILGELVHSTRDPVVKAHPDREQKVGLIYGPVDARRPVHAGPAEV